MSNYMGGTAVLRNSELGETGAGAAPANSAATSVRRGYCPSAAVIWRAVVVQLNTAVTSDVPLLLCQLQSADVLRCGGEGEECVWYP